MGLPEILIEFKAKAETAVARSQNGILAVILEDDTKTDDASKSYVYRTAADINTSHWSTESRRDLNIIFSSSPSRILVERVGTSEGYDKALARLKNKNWNWLAHSGT